MSYVTFVAPRYGADVVGGAESGARALATRLSADGMDVSVLTSRARSFDTWADDYPEGTTVEEGVSVSRFSVDHPRSPNFAASCDRLLRNPEQASMQDAWQWIDEQGPTSNDLLEAIAEVDRGVLAFTPYMYHPAVRGVSLARVPTVLHAAAHPEPPLRLPVFDDLFNSASAIAHYSRLEQRLVLDRFPATVLTPQAVTGLPVEAPEFEIDPVEARGFFGLGDEPFVLFLGRVLRSKGAHELVDFFAGARERRGDGKLVIAGPVVDEIPKSKGVVCVGPVSEQHKFGLLAAADALINPSPLESFSLVVLEAWLAGTPVLVNGWCGPTRDHCERSGGGLWYSNFVEFEVSLNRLLDDADLRDNLAEAGHGYVTESFSWAAVRRRYLSLVSQVR
ncbi:MAG: glycosyltransferase family 4 protein [Acidimicrobiaceae bacterium]|nr:glycosyltransferase family 4 protein [Acidimicrobiaceae bacterium]